jgi:hypothetical protein
MAGSDAIYVKQLSEVLKTRDVDTLREFLKSEAVARDPERVVEIESISHDDLQMRMYKMILARPELGDMHADARRWLREHEDEFRVE